MRAWIVIAVLSLAAPGCTAPALSTAKSGNTELTIEVIAEVDGYRVYRFRDSGHYIYFVAPMSGHAEAMTSWQQLQGKTSYPKSVHTLR